MVPEHIGIRNRWTGEGTTGETKCLDFSTYQVSDNEFSNHLLIVESSRPSMIAARF